MPHSRFTCLIDPGTRTPDGRAQTLVVCPVPHHDHADFGERMDAIRELAGPDGTVGISIMGDLILRGPGMPGTMLTPGSWVARAAGGKLSTITREEYDRLASQHAAEDVDRLPDGRV